MLNPRTTSPVTYNLRKEERNIVDELAKAKGISKSNVVREAIRLFKVLDDNVKMNKRLAFIDEFENVTKLDAAFIRTNPVPGVKPFLE